MLSNIIHILWEILVNFYVKADMRTKPDAVQIMFSNVAKENIRERNFRHLKAPLKYLVNPVHQKDLTPSLYILRRI